MAPCCVTVVVIISLILLGKLFLRLQRYLNKASCQTALNVRHPPGYPRTKTDCYEIAYSFEREESVYQSYSQCNKNENHEGFIPINDVSLEHFPPNYQKQCLVDLTKALAAITVKLTVYLVSPERPKTFADQTNPFPLGESAGKNIFSTGTGRIRFVNKSPTYDNKTCPCQVCSNSACPKRDWWMVGVVTAAHVVVDENEAKSTRCRIDYDTEENEAKTEKILNGYGIANRGVFIEEDRGNVLFCTHDPGLADTLASRVANYKTHCERIVEEFKNKAERDLVIIVSHPHGRAKCASFGTAKRKIEVETGFTKYEYIAMTCPGTSGAPVYVLDRNNLPFCNHPHSAAYKDKVSRGYSSGGY